MKRAIVVVFVVGAACLLACRGRQPTIAADSTDATAPPPPSTSASPSASIEIRTRTDANGWTTIEVTNVGHAPVSLSHALDVEVLGDAGWTSALAEGLSLGLDCSKAPCSTLAPGETAHPGQWWGATNGCVQDPCACTDGGCVVDCLSATAPKGRYRIVAKTCDGTLEFASQAFEHVPR